MSCGIVLPSMDVPVPGGAVYTLLAMGVMSMSKKPKIVAGLRIESAFR
jgi:hypothetical protein